MIMIINTNTNKRHKVFKQFCFFQSYLLYTIFETESAKAAKLIYLISKRQGTVEGVALESYDFMTRKRL